MSPATTLKEFAVVDPVTVVPRVADDVRTTDMPVDEPFLYKAIVLWSVTADPPYIVAPRYIASIVPLDVILEPLATWYPEGALDAPVQVNGKY